MPDAGVTWRRYHHDVGHVYTAHFFTKGAGKHLNIQAVSQPVPVDSTSSTNRWAGKSWTTAPSPVDQWVELVDCQASRYAPDQVPRVSSITFHLARLLGTCFRSSQPQKHPSPKASFVHGRVPRGVITLTAHVLFLVATMHAPKQFK